MKIVIFGEYKVERMITPLRRHGCQIVVYTEEPIDDMVGANVLQRSLDRDTSVGDIVQALRTEAPDAATTSIFALGQEQLLTTYSEAASRWAGRFVVHPRAFAGLACDKVLLYETALRRAWPVPEGAVCHDRGDVADAARRIGWPVLVKLARTQAGDGVHYVGSENELTKLLPLLRYPVVVMRFCDGVEVGVEFVSGEQAHSRWPVECAGRLDKRLAPLRRPRVSPYRLPSAAAADLDALIDDIIATYRPWGGWQLDLAVVDGRLLLLEINGRLGGLSELGLTTTGVDPHEVAALECLSIPAGAVLPERVGLEMTGTAGAIAAELAEDMSLIEIGWNSTHRSLKGTDLVQYILGVRRRDDAEAWVRTMAQRGLRVPVNDALAQLDRGFEALTAQSGAAATPSLR